jgi:hypothetical protein
VNGLDSRTVDVGDVGGVDEDERDDALEERVAWDAGDLERGHAEAEHVDDEDRGHAAEEVCVGDRDPTQREELPACAEGAALPLAATSRGLSPGLVPSSHVRV